MAGRLRGMMTAAGGGLGAALGGGAVLLTLTPSDAFAYIDPGSGALVWQAALSAFFGALFLARRALFRLFRALSRALWVKTESADTPGSAPSSADQPGPSD